MPHQGLEDAVNLTISICLCYTLCIACVRAWIRRQALGVDDAVIAFATLVTLSNSASSYIAVANGLSSSWDSLQSDGNVYNANQVGVSYPQQLSIY
jgi:hypothetical protein